MFKVYFLYSVSLDRYYIGHTADIEDRKARHINKRGSVFTKQARDWELKYERLFPTRGEAMKFENYLKKKKSRKFIEKLINSGVEE